MIALHHRRLRGRKHLAPAAGAPGAEEAAAVQRLLDETALRLLGLQCLAGGELDGSPDACLVAGAAELAGDTAKLADGVGHPVLVHQPDHRGIPQAGPPPTVIPTLV